METIEAIGSTDSGRETLEPAAKLSTRSRSLFASLAIPIVAVVVVGLIVMGLTVPGLLKDNAIEAAKVAATETANQYKTLRKYYVENVVSQIVGESSISASYDHANRDGTIPLPATMIHDISGLLADRGTSIKLYSPYPFPNRADRRLDAFEQAAWDHLQVNPDATFSQEVVVDGRRVLKTAVADTMVSDGCVTCHNTHPETPKVGWKLGELRGVLEVDSVIDNQIALAWSSTWLVLLMVATLAVALTVVIWLRVRSVLKMLGTEPQHLVAIARDIAIGELDSDLGLRERATGVFGAIYEMRDTLRERIETDRAKSAENHRITQALDRAEVALLVTDADLKIVYANTAARTLFATLEPYIRHSVTDFSANKLVGFALERIYPDSASERASRLQDSSVQKSILKFGNRSVVILLNPVVDEQSNRNGFVVRVTDKTEEIMLETDLQSVVDAARAGNLSERVDVTTQTGFFQRLGTSMNDLVSIAEGVVVDTTRVLAAVASGNLNESITKEYAGTFGELKTNANSTVGKLTSVVHDIKDGTGLVANEITVLAQGAQQLAARTEQQSSSLEETASSLEQTTSSVQQSAAHATKANELAKLARQNAENGGRIVNEAIDAMGAINTSSAKISDIVSVIDGLAFQTNLLALNASVEAARAGEQGRGFAVVAAEVRNLAERSATAAKEVKELIDASGESVAAGSRHVDKSGETLNEIVATVQELSNVIGEVADASAQQAQGITEISSAVSQIDSATQQNAALVEETGAACTALEQQMRKLNESIGFFSSNIAEENIPRQSNVA